MYKNYLNANTGLFNHKTLPHAFWSKGCAAINLHYIKKKKSFTVQLLFAFNKRPCVGDCHVNSMPSLVCFVLVSVSTQEQYYKNASIAAMNRRTYH